MNTFSKFIFTAVAMVVLQACVSVGVPQYDAIAQRVTPSTSELDAYTWELEFGDYQADVLAVNLPNGTGFTSKAGDALLFSKNTITLIGSLAGQKKSVSLKKVSFQDMTTNGSGLTEVAENEVVKQVLVDDQLFETITCQPTITTVQQNTVQRCQGEFEYVIKITYQNGQIIKIEQDIPFYNERLVLTK